MPDTDESTDTDEPTDTEGSTETTDSTDTDDPDTAASSTDTGTDADESEEAAADAADATSADEDEPAATGGEEDAADEDAAEESDETDAGEAGETPDGDGDEESQGGDGGRSEPLDVDDPVESGEDEDVVYVGNKAPMQYVQAAMTSFNQGHDRVIFKSRGQAISTAVDAAEILRRDFMEDKDIDDVTIGTEEVESEGDDDPVRLSSVRITME